MIRRLLVVLAVTPLITSCGPSELEVELGKKTEELTKQTEELTARTEELGKDMGFYTDPYSDFGRLGMELWRACRLVVDTGIHDKQWSREKAMAYLTENTPNPEGDIRKAIERYCLCGVLRLAHEGRGRVVKAPRQ